MNETQAWAAQLVILTFELLNRIAETGRVPLTCRPSIEIEKLAEKANQRTEDLSVQLSPRWIGRSFALKTMPPRNAVNEKAPSREPGA